MLVQNPLVSWVFCCKHGHGPWAGHGPCDLWLFLCIFECVEAVEVTFDMCFCVLALRIRSMEAVSEKSSTSPCSIRHNKTAWLALAKVH